MGMGLLLLLALAAPARAVLLVPELEALRWATSAPALEPDARALESLVLDAMARRGVDPARLSPRSRSRLRLIIAEASGEAPAELHFFAAAPPFDEDTADALFAALEDSDALAAFLRSQVAFVRPEDSGSAEPERGSLVDSDRRLDVEMAEGEGCSLETLFDGRGGTACGGGTRGAGAAPDDDSPAVTAWASPRALGPAEPE